MIPYFVIPAIPLGPVHLQPFGILTVLGIYTAAYLMARSARLRGLDPTVLSDFAVWGVVGGVIGAHLLHVLAYHPEELRYASDGSLGVWLRSGHFLQLFKIWDGLSSTGGVLGGIIAAAIFFRRRKASFAAYSDSIALGLAPGWAIARLGCFAVHDHLGRMTTFPLSVEWQEGIGRHDLGLDDALQLMVLSAILYFLERKQLLRGRLLAVLAILYGMVRFGLDFLRATDLDYVDARYLGLTPAQFACLAAIVYGIVRLARHREQPTALEA